MVHRQTRVARYLAPVALFAALVAATWPAGAGADEDFITGSGRARASLFEILPRTGGLTLPVSFGRAGANYQGSVARASSLAIREPSGQPPGPPAPPGGGAQQPVAECGNPGAPGSPAPKAGWSPMAGGGLLPTPSFSFPFAHTVDVSSDQKEAEAGKNEVFAASPDGSTVQGEMQRQVVKARKDPGSEAITLSGRTAIAGIGEIIGGRAEATTAVVDRKARVAHALTVLQKVTLLDGAVVLEDMRWEATQRTGDADQVEGAFSVGRITVGGTPLPAPENGADPFAELNKAIAPTGLAFKAPTVAKDGGVARVTPASLGIADSPVGRQVFGPILGALQPVRDPLVDGLLAVSCDFGLAVTVADVALGIASGSGGVSFDFGGTSATTEGSRYDDPFGGPGDDLFPGLDTPVEFPALPVTAAFEPPVVALPEPSPAEPEYLGGLPADGGAALPNEELTLAPGPATATLPAFGPASTHLPGRKGGTALAVGIIGLAAILALAVADALHLRRSARTIL